MHASSPREPLSPDIEDLIRTLMATGSYRSREDLLRAALRGLLESADADGAKHRLAAVLDGIGDAFYALDREWRYTIVNRAAEAYYGRPRESLLGQVIWDLFPWSAGTELRSRYEHSMRTREPVSFETASVGVPGRSLEVRLFPFEDGLGVSFRDWTERRLAESALRESEARLRLAVEAGRLAVWEYDVASDSVKPSPELNEILGYPRDAAIELADVRSRYGPGDRERMQKTAQEALARGDRYLQLEYRFLRPDGRWIWLLLRAEILLGPTGVPERIVGVVLDVTERRQAEDALRESETRLEIATAAANLGIWDWDLAANRMIYSDRAKAIYGFPLDSELTFEMVRNATHPEDLPRTSALARRALDPAIREKTPYEFRIRRPDGAERWILAHGEAVFETVAGEERGTRYVGTIQDITEQKQAEAALRESQARLTALADNLPLGMVYQVVARPDSGERRFTYVSRSCERVNGVPAEAALENAQLLYGLFPEEHLPELAAREEAAIRDLKPFDVEVPGRHAKTGELRWFRLLSAPRPLPDGSIIWDGLQVDITERKRAEDAVRHSEERLRAVLDEMPVGVVIARIPDGELLFHNARTRELIGQAFGARNSSDAEGHAIHPDGTPYRAEDYPIARTVVMGEEIDREEMIYRRPDGTLIHLEVSSTPMRWAGGEAFAVSAFYDITERKHAEDHQRLLINELNHRVKNTLATVQSIAAQSLRAVEAAEDGGPVARARAAFEDRLFALARAHDVLTRAQWESAALADIVGEAVAPHRGSTAGADRFAIDGPPLRAAPKMALSLSMALHELATNAVKYGALSGPGGRVVVGWTLPGSDAGRRMRLEWREEGGPPVTAPARKGFGTRLIEQGLARELGGTVELVYDPAGLRCLIDVPLEH